jgi:hypothetical protein
VVAHEHQPLFRSVVERDREHAVQSARELYALLFPEVDDDLGIGIRRETMTLRLELGAQLEVVVDFAVVEDGDGAVFVEDRLMSAGKIDDRQAAHAERHGVLDEVARVVRSAMHHRIAHARDVLARGRLSSPRGNAGDAAH